MILQEYIDVPKKFSGVKCRLNEQLVRRYRFGRRSIRHITRLVEDEISPATNSTHPDSATTQVLKTLQYFASSSYQQVVGDTIRLDKASCIAKNRFTLVRGKLIRG